MPHCQPHGMRGPGGRPPRLGLEGSCLIVSRSVGRCGQCAKWFRIWLVVHLAPQPQPHSIRGPGDRPMRLMTFGSTSQILLRTQFLHLGHVPTTQRLQNGRARCLNWRSSPQHKQTRSGVGREISSRLMHFWHLPSTQRRQSGRARYSDWRSAPQQWQTPNMVDVLTPTFYGGSRLLICPARENRPLFKDATRVRTNCERPGRVDQRWPAHSPMG